MIVFSVRKPTFFLEQFRFSCLLTRSLRSSYFCSVVIFSLQKLQLSSLKSKTSSYSIITFANLIGFYSWQLPIPFKINLFWRVGRLSDNAIKFLSFLSRTARRTFGGRSTSSAGGLSMNIGSFSGWVMFGIGSGGLSLSFTGLSSKKPGYLSYNALKDFLDSLVTRSKFLVSRVFRYSIYSKFAGLNIFSDLILLKFFYILALKFSPVI
jgi:hypothetical protein